MNLPKLFTKKNEAERSAKSPKAESSRKASLRAVKPKKTETSKRPSRKPEESRLAWWHASRQYLREVVSELKKVVWPSRKETVGSTTVVLVIVAVCGVFLGIVDQVLSLLVRMLIG